jgi:hypothetical protein
MNESKGERAMIYLLNSLIVPVDFSKFEKVTVVMRRATIEEVKELLRTATWESAVGHESTALLLTKIIGIEVPMRRVAVNVKPGDTVVHFALKTRLPEGRVLSEEELRQIDYYFVISEVYDSPPQRG